jgi:phosphopantothenoylcysteine decarboxylase/phosphopantothenate--cysteine ligase
MLKDKTVLLGITGGIAAYKACSLIRLYKKEGANVRVVVTPNALNFVTKLTLQTLSNNDVYIEQFDIDEYKPEHIALTDADIFVIAPATANTIGKIANGICDNLLTTTACAFNKPFLIAPTMNNNMLENKFVQENIKKLEENGYNIIYPSEGFLACGSNAIGRMKEPEEIFEKTVEILNVVNPSSLATHLKSGEVTIQQKLSGKKILITAGGTREKIDPVRYITNNSSGKMGIALANNAAKMGAEVTLVSTFGVNGNFKNIVTETAQEMEKIVKEELFEQDCVIMAAAVSDYRVRNYSEQKIKKGTDDYLNLELVKNPDILREISNLKKIKIRSGEYTTVCHSGEQENTQLIMKNEENKKNLLPLIVGFCAESEHLIENAKIKVKTKGCDYIVANDISRKDIGFNSDENEVYIIDKNLNINHIEKDSKENIAKKILENIFEQV